MCNLGAAVDFPGPQFASLWPAYEANFIALDATPLPNYDATKHISLRVEEGVAIR